ncbi:MAG: M28 family peptidase, partial [Vicinamibacterales bacterium]
ARLRAHIEMLAVTIGERNVWRYASLRRAADYLTSTFESNGYRPAHQTFEVSRLPVSNIAVELPGVRSDEILVVGAHYDTVSNCPGANDNGTGVAAILELSRRFAGRPHARAIRFVAFVNEEPPFFQTSQMGSLVYAQAARARGDCIIGMLSLETMGYYSDQPGSQHYPPPLDTVHPTTGNFIGFVSNVQSEPLLLAARDAFSAQTRFPLEIAAADEALPGVGWSDHWSFWEAGYPALMVTDTAPFRYPWYHHPEDTPDKISCESMADVVNGLEQVVSALAGAS